MKKILLIALVAILPNVAGAAVSVEDTTNATYLQNNGFSAQTAEMVSVSKARADYRSYLTEDEAAYKDEGKFAKFWRKLYVYTDPAAEDYSFYHHDTTTTPSYTDL